MRYRDALKFSHNRNSVSFTKRENPLDENGVLQNSVSLLLLLEIFYSILVLLSGFTDRIDIEFLARYDSLAHPLATLGYAAMSAALLSEIRSRHQISNVFVIATVAVLVLIAIEDSTGISVRIDPGKFPEAVATVEASPGGGPYIVTVAPLILLAIATAMAWRRGRRATQIVITTASIVLGISILAVCISVLGSVRTDPVAVRFLPSVPAAVQASFLAIALLLWRGRFGWSDLLSLDSAQAGTMRRVFPYVILIPALTALVEITLDHSGTVPPIVLDIAGAAVNIFVLALLIFWSMSRISAEHEALAEITHAMASAPIALTSLTGEILHWSRGCEELYGWSGEDMIGRWKYEALQSVDTKRASSLRPEDQHDAERELVERRRDGSAVHVIERVRRVCVPGRAPIWVQSMTDISARVAVEAALFKSETNLNLALSAHEIGAFDWEMASGKVTFSPGAEQRLGFNPGEIETLAGWAARVDPIDMAAMSETIASAARTHEERVSFHYQIHIPNGGVRAIEGSSRCLYDNDGRLERTIGVLLDVTDRDEREKALRAQEDQLRSVLETVPSPMVIFDAAGTIKAFSASAERMFGYPAGEAIGLNVEMLTSSSLGDQQEGLISRYLATGEKPILGEPRVLWVLRRDGTPVPVELWLGESQGGQQHLFTGFCKDLSERYAAEEDMSDMRDELLHISRVSAMGEMATGLAHELNQPLAAAVYFLASADLLLADSANIERAQAFIRMASEQALRAGEIIRRMRTFMSKEDVDAQMVDANAIIEDAVSLTLAAGRTFGIRFQYELDPAATTVLADRVQTQQVLVNLLRNAIEALAKSPIGQRIITITTALVDPDMVEFSVADTGPGMSAAVLDRLYMPFVSTKGGDGMGVGLSISRRIVEAHRGTFSAENQAGGGAIFRFTLPRISQHSRDDA
ncbi:PAS domain S-box protein [Sphingomonas echinoides]|uniref:PAS domain S-box protein n=1 Tax=Sphingomonas echinoides TaxID=59803 RepID=UPI002412F4C3|nr:PAS domain S-box protein [Sphingomonas echinoides]